ncbi:hypothetical protein D9756_002099 [Leucocoprinus leucothites]|uniref:Uncharacterized protein n=1 Tax=Leucocoprinus leucothites TaxID=201217 RepID=A0A8H5LM77_9AGAR|nr:hypothetical protein D9756_002099 [Leucoagaricus leucothites]
MARKSTIPSHMKWIYILGRYVGLAGQIWYIIALNYLTRAPKISELLCDLYWSAQVLLSAFSIGLVLFLSSKQVYSLWNRDPRMGVILSLLVALVEITVFTIGVMTIRRMRHQEVHCLAMLHIPGETVYAAMVTISVQTCISCLGLVNRECLLVAALGCIVPASVIIDGLLTKFKIEITVVTHLAFPTFFAVTTCMSCRMIQNTHYTRQKVVEEIPNPALGENSLILTSIGFDM